MTNCPICGNPTSSYMGNKRKDGLCRKHANDLKTNLIEKCDTCGNYKSVDKSCDFCKNEESQRKLLQTSKCIICNKDSKEHFFCLECFNKYKDKDLIIRISKCKTSELLEYDYYNKTYKTEDGHQVKSKDEVIIDNYLFGQRIIHQYERPFYTKDDLEILPDWTLPNYKDIGDILIEYWGIENNKKYEQSKKFKMQIYKEHGVTLICLNSKDLENLSIILQRKLSIIKKGQILE